MTSILILLIFLSATILRQASYTNPKPSCQSPLPAPSAAHPSPPCELPCQLYCVLPMIARPLIISTCVPRLSVFLWGSLRSILLPGQKAPLWAEGFSRCQNLSLFTQDAFCLLSAHWDLRWPFLSARGPKAP